MNWQTVFLQAPMHCCELNKSFEIKKTDAISWKPVETKQPKDTKIKNSHPLGNYRGRHFHFLSIRCPTSDDRCCHLHLIIWSILIQSKTPNQASTVSAQYIKQFIEVYHPKELSNTLPNKYSANTLKDWEAPKKSNPSFPGMVVSAMK